MFLAPNTFEGDSKSYPFTEPDIMIYMSCIDDLPLRKNFQSLKRNVGTYVASLLLSVHTILSNCTGEGLYMLY